MEKHGGGSYHYENDNTVEMVSPIAAPQCWRRMVR